MECKLLTILLNLSLSIPRITYFFEGILFEFTTNEYLPVKIFLEYLIISIPVDKINTFFL